MLHRSILLVSLSMMTACSLTAAQVKDDAQRVEDTIAKACPSIQQVEAGFACEAAVAVVQGFIELWGLTHPEMKNAVANHHKLTATGASTALMHVNGVPGWYPPTIAAELSKPETNAAMRAYVAAHASVTVK